ncbi:MAG: hypothetical protein HC884_15930, partial [Chloroflexaceae bacterium]|nr:hypothetical protein [Chloroflexaceae bacterium]
MMKDTPGTLPPQTLIQERYRVVRQIGEGNMGAVYEAYDEHLAQTVALKQTRTQGDQFSKAFEREAKILAGLRHPVLPDCHRPLYQRVRAVYGDGFHCRRRPGHAAQKNGAAPSWWMPCCSGPTRSCTRWNTS